jgi:hypothetical protein
MLDPWVEFPPPVPQFRLGAKTSSLTLCMQLASNGSSAGIAIDLSHDLHQPSRRSTQRASGGDLRSAACGVPIPRRKKGPPSVAGNTVVMARLRVRPPVGFEPQSSGILPQLGGRLHPLSQLHPLRIASKRFFDFESLAPPCCPRPPEPMPKGEGERHCFVARAKYHRTEKGDGSRFRPNCGSAGRVSGAEKTPVLACSICRVLARVRVLTRAGFCSIAAADS